MPAAPAPNRLIVSGVPEGYAARLVADLLRDTGRPVLHVARDDAAARQMRDALAFFAPDLPVHDFPAWDCLPYDRASPRAEVLARRMATLGMLARSPRHPFVLLTTLNAASQLVPPRELLQEAGFSARVGQRIDEAALRAFLQRMGFVQAPTVTEPGDYAIRGGLIDIYPPGAPAPVRLDLFGDVLDSARQFDPETQRTTRKLDAVELAPVSEVILDEDSIARFRSAYRHAFGAAGRDDPLYEAISAGRRVPGQEHWAPFFHQRMDSLFAYLPDDAPVTLEDGFEARLDARWKTVNEQYAARAEALERKSRLDSIYKPIAPELLYLDPGRFVAAIGGREMRVFAPLPRGSGPGVVDAGARPGRSFAPERKLKDVNLFSALADHIRARQAAGPVVLATWSEGARDRLGQLLADEGLTATPVAAFRDIPKPAPGERGGVFLAVWPLEQGFEAPGLTVISEQDVLGERLVRPVRRRRAENFLTEATALSPGDLVVHVEHGIGRYTGLETVTAAGAPHECLVLEYAGGDRLYLPVENVELLSRYGQDEGLLDRLGAGAWQARKARMKERIRDMAERLIRVAAERALRKAPVMTVPEHDYAAFCARFPWQETEDQLNAIADVLEDLASGRPMDRLICGDVGFGKTEVALRAAFVAAMNGWQVAVIAPTTLLARQHYRSFAERFRGTPVRVAQMSRFVPAREMAAARQGLADGSVDIVVGTHAVLGKGVTFANLGLLVIDEEQKFGVRHKERLKRLRSEIHVLTLTATPIPRTLQLSLSGVRDLSLIGTPPVDRLAIRTYVSEFDTVTIREALLREHYRGGQSFFVVPRVADIPEIEDFLREHVPEVSFVTAHGQLPAGELDKRMNAFYDGAFDVLLATTIVESGLDIPTANTMIIHRADMFGLAQLYQIRGRVGRAKTRAYAYLTTRPRAPLTPAAEKRLRVLGALDSLGAGFALASQDLDIRGAGNILGEEQSGQIREVGFELYQSMLEETIAKLKAGEIEGAVEPDSDWAPQINLGVPVLIPADYVPDLDVRLGLYRRLSGLSRKVEFEGFAAEMIDRFGPLPKEVSMLLNIVRIKAMCRRAGIGRLDGGPKGAVIRFHEDRFANPAGLVAFLEAQHGMAKIRDNRLVIRRDWRKAGDRVRGAYAIARDLAQAAKAPQKG